MVVIQRRNACGIQSSDGWSEFQGAGTPFSLSEELWGFGGSPQVVMHRPDGARDETARRFTGAELAQCR